MSKELVLRYQSANSQVMGSIDGLFQEYTEKLQGIKKISDFVAGTADILQYFRFDSGSYHSHVVESFFDYKKAKAALDAEYWQKVIQLTDVLESMSAKKRNEWNTQIHENKTPSFERNTVIDTVQSMLLSRGSYLAEKVDGIFEKLSGKHVTNSPMGFRSRLIISGVYKHTKSGGHEWGSIEYDKAEYLHDLRSVIAKLMNRDEPKSHVTKRGLDQITDSKKFGKFFSFDGNAFKIKIFKAGTAHLEIDPVMAQKLNRILATLHPQALASELKRPELKEKDFNLMQDFVPFAVASQLFEIAKRTRRTRATYFNGEDCDKKTKAEVERILELLGGSKDKHLWIFDYDVDDVLLEICRTSKLPEKKSHQYYPTQEELAKKVVALADISDRDLILEPSAGTGGLVKHLPKKQTTCVEVSTLFGTILEKKGFNVVVTNFLKWEPK